MRKRGKEKGMSDEKRRERGADRDIKRNSETERERGEEREKEILYPVIKS